MTKVLIGDIFESKMQTLVNTVNCVGVMGKGVAKKFKDNYPKMFEDYERRCQAKQVHPGVPYYYEDMLGTSIVNFPTKDHWRSPSRLSDILNGLEIFSQKYKEWGITSVAFPPLGCGNGGLEWTLVGPAMYQCLNSLDIDVEIYAPFGTPQKQLASDFLTKAVESSHTEKGAKSKKFNPEWLALIEVLRQLEAQPYSRPVGRTIFQKICYIMTELGTDTGFNFRKGSYGPFSDEIGDALHYFSNSNLIQEKQLGRMSALTVDKSFESYQRKFESVIDSREKAIRKTVDLFSRIKNTAQAEEVTTVLFSAREIKGDNELASEQELLDHILEWKKSWNKEDKRVSLASTMRNLEMLNWLKLDYSESLTNQPS